MGYGGGGLMANIANFIVVDLEPEVDNDEWPQIVGIGGEVIPNQGTFVAEGTHTEPLIGQIWPRIG
jgi:hypothetical protein